MFIVTKSCLTLCNPKDCSTPDSSVLHYLPQFAQIYVHWVSDAISPSHSLMCHSLLLSIFPSLKVFFNDSLFVPPGGQKYWTFSFSISPYILFRADFLQDRLVCFPYSPRDSQEASPTPQFKSIHSSALNFLYGPTRMFIHYKNAAVHGVTKSRTQLSDWTELNRKNHSFDYINLWWQSDVSAF